MSERELTYFEFFSGFVPSGMVFLMAADEIIDIARSPGEKQHTCLKNNLCLIGLASYFEAFTKDHLASVISIAPELIERLRATGI
ncbi:MAG: hypothetical protein ACYDH9_11470 [Limisphaerales bacterium]